MLALLLAAAFYLPPNPTISPLWTDWQGGFWNVGKGNEQADTNAVAHVWGGMVCTLAGHEILRRLDVGRPALKAALICTGLGLARLFLIHAPQDADLTGCSNLLAPIGCRPHFSQAWGYGAELRAGATTWLGGVWGAGIPLMIF
jgi:hypothetical protein